MSNIDIIQAYIAEHIPITQALGITLEFATDRVMVNAPLQNNINHKMTAFGGSLHAVATIACWSLLYQHFIHELDHIEIVISHSDVDYLLPVTSDFRAICRKPDEATWDKFSKILSKKGKARITLHAQIFQFDKLAVDYRGTFVVLAKGSSSSNDSFSTECINPAAGSATTEHSR